MAESVVSIYNLALQKLGAGRVQSITEDSKNARSCTACYEHLRDLELRTRAWRFSIKRVSLAASTTTPLALVDKVFPDANAFPLPSDCLRYLIPPRTFIDWTVENIDGAKAIITNDTAPLKIRYIYKVTDPTEFDDSFAEMLICKMALQMCEDITQSTTKFDRIKIEYRDARRLARQMNAFESIPIEAAMDSWEAARDTGSSNQAPWLSGQNL